MAKYVYQDSPFGIAQFPHLNRPDAKFNPDNPLYKTGLVLEGDTAEAMVVKVDAAADAAFEDYFNGNGEGAKLAPGLKKKALEDWKVYRPYERELDGETGEPTGRIVFDFKQNAHIKLRDGTVKDIQIGLYDAAGKEMKALVRGGSEIRVNYSMRPITMTSLKKVGVRLDFSRVQVRKLSEGNSGGFGAVEGYVDDGQDSGGFGQAEQPGTPSGSADY